MKNFNIVLFFALILIGCSNGKPSIKDMKITFVKLKFGDLKAKKEVESKFLKVVSFEKINAKEINLMGTQGYIAEYSARVEFKSDCWQKTDNGIFAGNEINCYKTKPKQKKVTFALFGPSYKMRKKGEIEDFKGELAFEKTEKGWKAQTGDIF